MLKNIKGKIACSLFAGVLLSSSAASAANFNYTNINYSGSYNNYKNVYTSNYDYNGYNYNQSTKNKDNTNTYPVFNWDVIDSKASYGNNNAVLPDSKPVYPSKPNIEEKPIKESKPVVPTAPSFSGSSQIESEVLRLVNIERQKEGLTPLVADSQLSNVARKKSEDMATNNYFSHTSPTYGSLSNMLKSFGVKYNAAGENIARGQSTAQSVMNGWMNSSGHRANIMNPSFHKIGIGMAESKDGRKYWTQTFTN